jgi:7-keto-8-aminopelargonate synthetase-like enzyme
MALFRCASAFVFLTISFASAQTEKTFPTDDEINLVLTQTERAIQQYKPLIDQQEIQMGKSATDAVAHDRQVVKALETAVKAFKGTPQGFNGPLGFAFFEWLDDAERNAVLCGSGASAQAALQIMAGNKDKADSLLHLAQSCSEVSALIYTVSENTGSLYQRYVAGVAQLAVQAAEAAEKCMDVLKKNSVTPKQ